MKTPAGITPPTPHLDREEPEFRGEDDIPADDGSPAAAERPDRGGEPGGMRDERPLRKVERE